MSEIICAGFGGQGVLVAGLILANAGMEQGKNVTWYPSYGSEMRGGTANCNVKISEREIASPYAKKLDVLYTLNEASIDKFERLVKQGGILLVNSSLTSPERSYRGDIRVVRIPATDIASECGNQRGTNIAMLGALAATSDVFSEDYLREAVDRYFAVKGKVNPLNRVCFDRGAAAAKEA